MTAQRGEPAQGQDVTDNRQRAAEVLGFRELEQAERYARDDLERIAAALDAAEERGRESIGPRRYDQEVGR